MPFHATSTPCPLFPFDQLSCAMPEASLIPFAARIEAAVAAYVEIRDFADENVWRAAFEQEKVSPSFRILHGVDLTPIYSSGISQMHLALSEKGTATWICIQRLPLSLSFLMTKAISATSQRRIRKEMLSSISIPSPSSRLTFPVCCRGKVAGGRTLVSDIDFK